MENLESYGIGFFIFQAWKVIGFHFRLWKVIEFANKRRKNDFFSVLLALNCLCSLLFPAFLLENQSRELSCIGQLFDLKWQRSIFSVQFLHHHAWKV
jgi:hypothetical protein